MRTFMIGFLIFILASCLALLMFKPMFNKENKEETSETSRVEELLTGKQQISEKKSVNPEEITSDFKPFEDELSFERNESIPPERPNFEDYIPPKEDLSKIKDLKLPEQLKVEDINKMTSPQQNVVDEKTYKEIENKINNDPKLQAVTNELREKYKNNPNAEVSSEDINYFMLKMLESSQTP